MTPEVIYILLGSALIAICLFLAILHILEKAVRTIDESLRLFHGQTCINFEIIHDTLKRECIKNNDNVEITDTGDMSLSVTIKKVDIIDKKNDTIKN